MLERKPKGQPRLNNPETQASLGTQDTVRRQTKHRKLKRLATWTPSKNWWRTQVLQRVRDIYTFKTAVIDPYIFYEKKLLF
jgi:hypothetical protein